MDHLEDNELAGFSHSNCSSHQQLNDQVETGDEWCSSEVGFGTGVV